MVFKLTGFLWILMAGAVFGLIHSALASLSIKNLAARWLGEKSRKYYRLFFVVVATLTTLVYLSLVVLLPDRIIYIVPTPWVYLTVALQGLSVVGVMVSFSQISAAGFLGLTALPWFKSTVPADRPSVLVTSRLYSRMRHPIYTCSFLFLLCMPWMSWNLLAFTIGVVTYTVIGAVFEERKMVQEFGTPYVEYQKKTPMFLPFRLK